MDLNPLIARVAVLRAEAREKDAERKAAYAASEDADRKFEAAQGELNKEIKKQIKALDPEGD